MSDLVKIGRREVGGGRPCFVIAEAGVNHNGDPALAHRLIDRAADCGADAVKFQTFDPDALVARDSAPAPYQRATSGGSQHRMLSELLLPDSAWTDLSGHAAERDVIFLSTPFDEWSAERLIELGTPALKVGSGELSNLPFVRTVAGLGVPLVVSTGMGTLDEVRGAVEAASPAPGLALLHCVSAYPAPVGESNLRAIGTMRDAFDVPVGWSDHTVGATSAIAAVALGAALLEKHLTLDRAMLGPDHAASADPDQFTAYVALVREAEAALGDGYKRPSPTEEKNRFYVRRSMHTARDLEAGHVLRPDDIVLLRPDDGLPPTADVTDRRLARGLAAGSPVQDDDLA